MFSKKRVGSGPGMNFLIIAAKGLLLVVSLVPEVLHVGPDEHLAQPSEVAVVLILHLQVLTNKLYSMYSMTFVVGHREKMTMERYFLRDRLSF